ncbi:MAG TPA: TonB C-terminal domain-containing protein [Rhizomicrobium sp.]|jgi:hypothetical protein
MTYSPVFYSLAIAVLMNLLWPCVSQGQPLHTDPAEKTYAIPVQPLNTAITIFATVSDVDVLYDKKLGENRISSPVVGQFSPQRAILLLLQGTGLICRFTGPNAAVIFPADKPDAEAAILPRDGASIDLNTLRITASPVIGRPENASFEAYGREAQAKIYQRLQSDPQLRSLPFQIEIKVRIDSAGHIQETQFIHGSSNDTIDAKVVFVLEHAQLTYPPPNMPMPLHFRVGLGER